MIPVQIDRCPQCDYVWLDPGELDLLLRLYRELMTEDDPAIAEKRSKLAQLDSMRAAMPTAAVQAVTNDFDRTTSITNNALNTGLNIATDLTSRNPGVSVAVDVAEFLISLLVR